MRQLTWIIKAKQYRRIHTEKSMEWWWAWFVNSRRTNITSTIGNHFMKTLGCETLAPSTTFCHFLVSSFPYFFHPYMFHRTVFHTFLSFYIIFGHRYPIKLYFSPFFLPTLLFAIAVQRPRLPCIDMYSLRIPCCTHPKRANVKAHKDHEIVTMGQ